MRWLSWLLAVAAIGCGGSGRGDSDSDGGGGDENAPFRGEWECEADLAFPYLDGAGEAQIQSVGIGGTLSNDNFANQGDVIVNFDGPPDRIKIEIRRFTMARSEETAEAELDLLFLWAFNADVDSPKSPDLMDPENDCLEGAWKDGCGIRIYYDGQQQTQRSGADIRVTLPPNYKHQVDIVTEDPPDADYHNRGNVCISNLGGSASARFGSGVAFVSLAREIGPAPACSAAGVAECEASEWSTDCPCSRDGDFGRVDIQTHDASAALITVDAPPGLWASVSATNNQTGQSAAGDHCVAEVGLPGYQLDDNFGTEETRDPWRNLGTAAKPNDDVLSGAGYSIHMVSSRCVPVSFTENPEDYVGEGNGSQQESEPRGDLLVCADCIAGRSCDDLLP